MDFDNQPVGGKGAQAHILGGSPKGGNRRAGGSEGNLSPKIVKRETLSDHH